jgi:hypothetical protein
MSAQSSSQPSIRATTASEGDAIGPSASTFLRSFVDLRNPPGGNRLPGRETV